MEIEQYLYDLNDSGDAIVAYTMRAASGATVQLCNLGASLLSFTIPIAGREDLDIASGRCVKGLKGLLDDKERFEERLWESRVEVNRVIMSLSYECDGVGIMSEVVFDFDDDERFEITYQACLDSDAEFDLSHKLSFNLGGANLGETNLTGANLGSALICDVKSEGSISIDNIYHIDGARRGILGEVATLRCEGAPCCVNILSSQPSLYFDGESIATVTSHVETVRSGERFVQKSLFEIVR